MALNSFRKCCSNVLSAALCFVCNKTTMIMRKILIFITQLSVILLVYQASLVGHMDKMHLLAPSTVFMEFGAGRGRYLMLKKNFRCLSQCVI